MSENLTVSVLECSVAVQTTVDIAWVIVADLGQKHRPDPLSSFGDNIRLNHDAIGVMFEPSC